MGPPTISADQASLRGIYGTYRSGSFNGAADDLGGSSWSGCRSTYSSTRFNGAADDLGGSRSCVKLVAGCSPLASMGPPTISADQGQRANGSTQTCVARFNGAADDLGGSSRLRRPDTNHSNPLQWGRRRSRRIKRDVDDGDVFQHRRLQWGRRRSRRIKSTPPSSIFSSHSLQWGRRRSRRIKEVFHTGGAGEVSASMGPPTISADQDRRTSGKDARK